MACWSRELLSRLKGVFVFIIALQLNTELSAYPEIDESHHEPFEIYIINAVPYMSSEVKAETVPAEVR